jgi:hypothetical protein
MQTRFDCGPGSLCLFGNCTTDLVAALGEATDISTPAQQFVCECRDGYKHDRFGLFYRDCGAPWWADIIFYGGILLPAIPGLVLTTYQLLRSLCARKPLYAGYGQQAYIGSANTPGTRHRNKFLIIIFSVCLTNLMFAIAHMLEGRLGPAALATHVLALVVFFAAALYILFTFRNLVIRLTQRTGSSLFGVTAAGIPMFCSVAVASLCAAAASVVPATDRDDDQVGLFNSLYGATLSVMAVNSVTTGYLLLRELTGLSTLMRGWLQAFQEEISSRRTAAEQARNHSRHSAVSQTRTYTYTKTRTRSHNRTLSLTFATQLDDAEAAMTSSRTSATTTAASTPKSFALSPKSPPTLPRRPRPESGRKSRDDASNNIDGNKSSKSNPRSGDEADVEVLVGGDEDVGEGVGQFDTLVVRKSASDAASVSSWDKHTADTEEANNDTSVESPGHGDRVQYNTVIIRPSASKNSRGASAEYQGPPLSIFGLSEARSRSSSSSSSSSDDGNESVDGDKINVEVSARTSNRQKQEQQQQRQAEEAAAEEEMLKREREDTVPDFDTFLATGAGGGAGKDGRNIALDLEQEPREMDFLQLAYLKKFADRVNFFKGALRGVLVITFFGQAAIVVTHFLIGFPLFWAMYTTYWFVFSSLWIPLYRLHMAMGSSQMKSKGRRMHMTFVRSSRQSAV